MSTAELEQSLDQLRTDVEALRAEVSRVMVGQREVIEASISALLAGGHVLLEGGAGLGKTLLVRALAGALSADFRRIQFTPDLMPADVLGTYVVMESHGRRQFEFQQGPIFTNILLADEINRATPKTQSALLEGLEEGGVTIANRTYELPNPFFTMATQSAEGAAEGTFPLPEKQLDRFLLKLKTPFPTAGELETILDRTTESEQPATRPVLKAERLIEMRGLVRQVLIAPEIRRFAIDALLACRPEHSSAHEQVRRYVQEGPSPRGVQAMVLAAKMRALLAGRVNVSRDDLAGVAPAALRHRITLNFEGHAEGIDPDDLIRHAIQPAGRKQAQAS